MGAITNDRVTTWLTHWADHINRRDYSGARALFSPTCGGFGTVANRTEGLDDLIERQWQRVWGRTRGFAFLNDEVRLIHGEDMAVAAVEWISKGLDPALDDTPFERRGRATIVLRDEGGALVCHHTHFSISPVPERFLT